MPLAPPLQPEALKFSEHLAADGGFRPAWQPVIEGLRAIGVDGVARRWSRVEETLREHDASVNSPAIEVATPAADGRARSLDPLPYVLDESEWEPVAAGVAQRARLLDAVLRDLLGPGSLIAEGLLPGDLLHGNPAYPLACLQPAPPHAPPPTEDAALPLLGLIAFDLVRGGDGVFRVARDRTGRARGLGHALEHRIAVSRAFPDLFRDCNVQRQVGFFRELKASLTVAAARVAPEDEPRVVLLTPGAESADYFENAFLARYLDLTVAEPGDLTVRDQRLYLKTLGGLQRVHAVLRQVPDAGADPLELVQDVPVGGAPADGVAGLLSACRAGQVAVVNALGAALLDGGERGHVGRDSGTRLCDHLPALCRHLLGEELLLHAHGPGHGFSPAPLWDGGGVPVAPLTLRVFATAGGGGAYSVLPGGLATSSATASSAARLRDTWVRARQPAGTDTLAETEADPPAGSGGSHSGRELPSRVADNFFWLGRYSERASGTASLLRVILRRVVEETPDAGCPELPGLLRALVGQTGVPLPAAIEHDPLADYAATAAHLSRCVHGPETDALLAQAHGAVRLAASLRDRISPDTWRTLNDLEDTLQQSSAPSPRPPSPPLFSAAPPPATARPPQFPRTRPDVGDRLTRLVAILEAAAGPLAAFAGHTAEAMTRTAGWRFLDLGRRIERAQYASVLLREMAGRRGAADTLVLDALLEAMNSRMTFRDRYHAPASPTRVLDLLLLDDANPCGVAYQIDRIEKHFRRLELLGGSRFPAAADADDDAPDVPGVALVSGGGSGALSPVARILLRLRTTLQLADPAALAHAGPTGCREELRTVLDRLDTDMPDLSERLVRRYLTHARNR